MRATLGEVLTDDAFARMVTPGAVEQGRRCDERHGPVDVTRLGCRVEYLFRAERPRNGTEPLRAATRG
jgi:glutamate-1-semialdehyde 2,1-aminomutase